MPSCLETNHTLLIDFDGPAAALCCVIDERFSINIESETDRAENTRPASLPSLPGSALRQTPIPWRTRRSFICGEDRLPGWDLLGIACSHHALHSAQCPALFFISSPPSTSLSGACSPHGPRLCESSRCLAIVLIPPLLTGGRSRPPKPASHSHSPAFSGASPTNIKPLSRRRLERAWSWDRPDQACLTPVSACLGSGREPFRPFDDPLVRSGRLRACLSGSRQPIVGVAQDGGKQAFTV